MNELNDIQKAVIELKILRIMAVSKSKIKALDMAIEIMEPIREVSTVSWQKEQCTFAMPTGIGAEPNRVETIKQEAIRQMLPILAEEVEYFIQDEFETDQTIVRAYLIVGKKQPKEKKHDYR